MSDPSMQFGGTAVADAPTSVLPPEFGDTSEAGGDRRKLMIVGGLALVLVVAVAGFFLMHKGSAAEVPSGLVKPLTAHPVGGGAGAPHATAAKPVRLPQPYNGSVGRDPFKPLYAAPVAQPSQPAPQASAPTTTGTPTVPVTAPSPVPVVSIPTTTGTGGTTGTGTPPTAPKPFKPLWIELVTVQGGTSSATFAVGLSNGSVTKTVTYANVKTPAALQKQGWTEFGKFFSLLSVGEDSTGVYAVIKYVDAAPFNLYMGTHNRAYVGN